MNLVRNFSIGLICLSILGCSSPKVLYQTEYQKVQVPVVIPIDRPNRPVYSHNDSVPTYLIKVLEYTKILELLIDEHNSSEVKNEL